MMAETRREEGCISYTFSADLEDPGVFLIFEEWESQDALDFHFKTPHMATFQGLMGAFGIVDMKVQRYDVAAVGPVRG